MSDWINASKARKFGEELASSLGPDWEVDVWENLGWYTCVRKDTVSIYPHKYSREVTSYTAFLNIKGSGGGIWAEHGETPIEALENTLAVGRLDAEKRMQIVTRSQEILDEMRSWKT